MGRALLAGWGALVVRCPIVVMYRTRDVTGASRAGTLWPRARQAACAAFAGLRFFQGVRFAENDVSRSGDHGKTLYCCSGVAVFWFSVF